MRGLIRFAVGNPVASNLIFLAILIVGAGVVQTLPREVFPDFSRQGVEVQVVFPNASPQEVERLVAIPIEEAADGVEGTDEIRSISQQAGARILIQLKHGRNVQGYLDEFRMAVDAIQDWPEDAEDPMIFEQKVRFPVVSVNLYGNLNERESRDVAERLRERFKAIDNVSSVTLFGVREPEIWLEVRAQDLERYDLTLAELSIALGGQVRDYPGGSLETEAGHVILRVLGEETDAEALGRKTVRALPDGTLLRVSDVARVRHDFEEERTKGRYNGYESISLQISKDRTGDVIDMVQAVDQIVEEERPRLPAGLSLGVSSDFSIYVKNRLRTLLQSGIFGLAIVLILLWVFLDARIALMTAIGIPVAVMGGAIAMGMLGITMNMLSMFAFILVLGLVVDDAIVVVENCFRYAERGVKPFDAAILGTLEVAWPVVTTVCTTVAAFGSMLMIEGELGQWMKPVPWVAGLTLAASLLEALLVLPSHFAEWFKLAPEVARQTAVKSSSQKAGTGRWYANLHRGYERLLRTCVRHRYPTLLGAIGLVMAAGALFQSGHLKFVLMPKFEAKLFMLNIETPTTYSLTQTHAVMTHVEDAVGGLPAAELESFVTLSGATYRDQSSYRSGNHLGQVFVELAEGGDRTRTTEAIQEDLRARLGHPAGVRKVDFAAPQAGPGGPSIELTLIGENQAQLRAASAAIQSYLSGYQGVVDIRDDLIPGTREVRLSLTDEGRMLGFNEAALAREVLGAFAGDRAAILRLDRDPADLLVRNPEEVRNDFRLLREMRVHAPSGASVPLDRVARLDEGRGLAQVLRKDRLRSTTISADVTLEANAAEITRQLIADFSDLEQRFPGVRMSFGGDQKRTVESIQSLFRAMAVSFVLIYLLLALLFRSYLQPVVVLLSVPFAFLGVFFGFAAIGEPLSFMTMMGIMALSGVAVNDALVLVDFVNKHRSAGHGLIASVLRAGSVRMRPVLLTSLTTIGGLIPLAFLASGQARFLSPMAMALIFGMVTATLMTLILVPIGYLILMDIKRLVGRLAFWQRGAHA